LLDRENITIEDPGAVMNLDEELKEMAEDRTTVKGASVRKED
jgi:hypothetical protein